MTSRENFWDENEHGLWCGCCGDRVASNREVQNEEFIAPESCRQCGFPDPELVAQYHCPDDFEPDEPEWDAGDECGRWINGKLSRYCTLAGTEQCDWECPYS